MEPQQTTSSSEFEKELEVKDSMIEELSSQL
jgi:hypothetical protein